MGGRPVHLVQGAVLSTDGLVNFRAAPAGRLYRSESLAYASAADAERIVTGLGVATIVDLRGLDEIARRGRGRLADLPVRYLSVPITDVDHGGGDLARFYLAVLTERGDALAGLIRRLAEPDTLPAIVHCEAGCDRTGIVVALLMGLLDLPDDVICADFELSREALGGLNARWRAQLTADGRPLPERYRDEVWDERAEAMDRTVAAVRERWGGWAGWAAAHGLTCDDLDRLRAALRSG